MAAQLELPAPPPTRFTERSQCAVVFDHLSRGLTLSQYEATVTYGITNLSQRVKELRQEGHRINCEWTRSETGKRYGRYRLVAA
ncbi:MAG: helix-turn-helix domain-containing protein [bacterium]